MAKASPAGAAPAVIRPGELPLESETENPLSFRRIIRRDHHGAGISMTWIRLKGRHRRLVCHESDRVYYILTGSAEFRLGEAAPKRPRPATAFSFRAARPTISPARWTIW